MPRAHWLLIASLLLLAAPLWAGELTEAEKKAGAECAAKAQALLNGLEQAEASFFQVDPTTGMVEPEHKSGVKLHGWTVIKEIPLKHEPYVKDVRAVLQDAANFGGVGANCFVPGMAFRFKSGDKELVFLICLDCSWVYVYEGDKHVETFALTDVGRAAFAKLYERATGEKPESLSGRKREGEPKK